MVTETVSIKGTDGVARTPFDIIVLSHNKVGLVSRCIENIYQSTLTPFHLIVVDDSVDLTHLVLKSIQKEHQNMTVVHSDKPYKCGNQIFNVGLQHCKYDFVATVMNSMTVLPDWEVIALELLKNDPKVATVGLKCLFEHNRLIESAGIGFAEHIPQDIGVNFPPYMLSAIYDREAVQWAFAIHRRSAIAGNLNENTYNGFVGWDDIDNCFVLRKNGWKVIYCGSGVGIHEPRATRGRNDAEGQRLNNENAYTFYKRWGLWDTFKKNTGYKDGDPPIPWQTMRVADNSTTPPSTPVVVAAPQPQITTNRAERRRLMKAGKL